jgi:crotonobetainyl-CoA:carnitine CoA-transferase CaiB-like acyl-CoA transferase
MHAVIGILTALYARQNTGRGQQVDASATDGVVSMMSAVIDSYLATGDEPSRGRSLLTGQYPWYNIYETKDGQYLSVGAIEAKFYANVCRLLGLEDLVPHQYAKADQQTEIFRRFREAFLTRTRDEWMAVFGPADTCVMPVYALSEVVTDPHLLQREMVIEVEHPEHGRIRQAGIMVKLSDTPGVIRWVDPKAKEHGPTILQEAGYSAAEIERLRADAVVD